MKRLFVLIFIFVLSLSAFAQGPQEMTVSSVEVKGNKVISLDKIITKIKTRVNQLYKENVVSEDIKRIFSLGYFNDISVETEEVGLNEVKVVFVVEEKPVVKDIVIEGAERIRKSALRKKIGLKEGDFLSEIELKEASEALKDLYVKKGYSDSFIDYSVEVNEDTNKAKVVFNIDERKRLRIKKISVEGNVSFSDKRILKLIKTKPAGWLFQAGFFKPGVFEDDLKRIQDFYKRKGFTDAEVDYSKDVNREKGLIYITLNIKEGKRYLIGSVDLKGLDNVPEEEVQEVVELKEGDIYSEEKVQEQVAKIQEVAFNRGYIFAQVKPVSFVSPETGMVDLTFEVNENELTYVRMIDIRGNTKTKDKVIRRELKLKPMKTFDGKKLNRSRQNLKNLGFFEEVNFDTEPTDKSNYRDLVVDVKEAKTGSFSFGGGYSSVDEFVGFIEVRQRNFDITNWPYFTGAGQDLKLHLQAGSTSSEYMVSFTEPWLFDNPVSLGFDVYQNEHDRESDVGYGYSEQKRGAKIRLGRRFSDFLRGGVSYNFERIDISDVDSDESEDLEKEVGENDISTLGLSLTYDKRDSALSPHKGYITRNSVDLAGGVIGGDKDFMRAFTDDRVFFPLIHDSVLELRVRAGIVKEYDDSEEVPIYERFFAGGASTIRGYQERKAGPIDSKSDDPVGGDAMFVGNIEYTYPVGDYFKVATFFDIGNVWKESSNFFQTEDGREALYSGVGLGIRVKTPLGPVKIDYGYPLDKEPGEEDKEPRFHFNVSRGF